MSATTPFHVDRPQLSASDLTAINLLARWLALDDISGQPQRDAGLLILAGNAVVPVIEGAIALAMAREIPLLITGGIGHSTRYLATALACHPRWQGMVTHERSEAEMIGAMARHCGLADRLIWLETAARHSGENAAFSQSYLAQRRLSPASVILVQDPLMQRRTHATFIHQWRHDRHAPLFINWPVYRPQLQAGAEPFGPDAPMGLWPRARFLSLLMGEIPRLRNDRQGYGPLGQGFIGEHPIPAEIEHAWQQLRQRPQPLEGAGERTLGGAPALGE